MLSIALGTALVVLSLALILWSLPRITTRG
jgi:hypothetical protein